MRTREFIRELAKTTNRKWSYLAGSGEAIRCGGDTCPIAAVAGIKGSALWLDMGRDAVKPKVANLNLNKRQIDEIVDASDGEWGENYDSVFGRRRYEIRQQIIKALNLT